MPLPTLRPALFRSEACAAQRDDGLGAPLSARFPGEWLLTGACVALVAASVALASQGSFSRKAHVSGALGASLGAVRVVAPQAGVVTRLSVSEGQRVSRGQPLAVVSSERSTAAAERSMAAAQDELRNRRASLLRELTVQGEVEALAAAATNERIQNLLRQAAQVGDQVDLQRRRVASIERNLDRQRALRQSDFISESALQQKEEELLDQRAQLAMLSRNAGAAESDLAAARSEVGIARLRAGNGMAALRRQVSELEQLIAESEERREIVLTAPVDGVVTTALISRGQAVSASQAVLTLLPEGSVLQAQLLVPTRAAGFIKPGQEVALRYEAFPYQQFGHALGEVTEIGRVVVQAADLGLSAPGAEPGYRVTVRLPSQSVVAYGKPVPLRHGMAVDADVLLERRRLLDWIFEPLLALHGRL